MNWTERFDDGAWQPLQDKDVVVFLAAGTQYLAIDATERNMAGLAAVARMISPELEDRARHLARQTEETQAARRPRPSSGLARQWSTRRWPPLRSEARIRCR